MHVAYFLLLFMAVSKKFNDALNFGALCLPVGFAGPAPSKFLPWKALQVVWNPICDSPKSLKLTSTPITWWTSPKPATVLVLVSRLCVFTVFLPCAISVSGICARAARKSAFNLTGSQGAQETEESLEKQKSRGKDASVGKYNKVASVTRLRTNVTREPGEPHISSLLRFLILEL